MNAPVQPQPRLRPQDLRVPLSLAEAEHAVLVCEVRIADIRSALEELSADPGADPGPRRRLDAALAAWSEARTIHGYYVERFRAGDASTANHHAMAALHLAEAQRDEARARVRALEAKLAEGNRGHREHLWGVLLVAERAALGRGSAEGLLLEALRIPSAYRDGWNAREREYGRQTARTSAECAVAVGASGGTP